MGGGAWPRFLIGGVDKSHTLLYYPKTEEHTHTHTHTHSHYRKFTTTDPGLEKVGKIGVDGNPMTILDIARQGDQAFEGPVTYSFCANCEVREI